MYPSSSFPHTGEYTELTKRSYDVVKASYDFTKKGESDVMNLSYSQTLVTSRIEDLPQEKQEWLKRLKPPAPKRSWTKTVVLAPQQGYGSKYIRKGGEF